MGGNRVPRANPHKQRGNIQTLDVAHSQKILACIAGPSETMNIPFREDFCIPLTLSLHVDSIFDLEEHAINNTLLTNNTLKGIYSRFIKR